MKLEGSVALVTGGASGLGEGAARLLAERGMKVAVLDVNAGQADAVARSIGGFAVTANVAVEEEVRAAHAAVVEALGTPRAVVHAAGIASGARVVGREGQLSLDVFRRTIEVNLIGTYTVMSVAAAGMTELPALEDGERGVIINTASIAYQDGQVGQCAYAAAKGGVVSLGLPAARELGRFGIRVMTIAPGLFATPMMSGLPEELRDSLAQLMPFPPRLGKAGEYAALAAHILENPLLNGEVIRLDGGARLPAR